MAVGVITAEFGNYVYVAIWTSGWMIMKEERRF